MEYVSFSMKLVCTMIWWYI